MSSVVKYLVDQNTLISDLGGSINIESDCEGDPRELGEETQRAMEGSEELRAVFITGSFSAYAAFHPAILPRRVTGFLAGSHFSSIAAQTRSCSLPSNPKVPTLA